MSQQSRLARRKRSQRGSVLSGVLIIVAFLSILVGALMTELSTNLLVSRALVNRVGNQATVNSAVELAIDQIQHTPLTTACPALPSATLNGRTAAATYASCALVGDSGSTQFQQLANTAAFNFDGTHFSSLPLGRNDYLVGDAAGNVFDYQFDQVNQRLWKRSLGGSVTGPPLEMPDVQNSPQVSILVPVSSPTAGANPDCGPANYCVAYISDGGGASHKLECYMAASAMVTAQPAAGINNKTFAYFGDGNGKLYVYDSTDGGDCAQKSSASIGQPVVAGPIVFPGPGGTDELYLVTSNNTSSQLVHYTYTPGPGLDLVSSVALPASNAVGVALEPGSLPSDLAITFLGGVVAVDQIQSGFGMSIPTSTSVPTNIDNAPYWCQCSSGALIGAGGRDGGLYLFDTSLTRNATYPPPPGGPAVTTTPTADSIGDWFFGAADGHVYEVQRQAALPATMVVGAIFGSAGPAMGSSPILGSCQIWICVYTGSAASLYELPLQGRHAEVTACISAAPPACSLGTNPRLWTSMDVGSASNSTTVHVRGWSYYSP